MDESLEILRSLSDGKPVSFGRRFFSDPATPNSSGAVVAIRSYISGRSDAAVRRAGRFGDGWLGIWVSAGTIRFCGESSR